MKQLNFDFKVHSKEMKIVHAEFNAIHILK